MMESALAGGAVMEVTYRFSHENESRQRTVDFSGGDGGVRGLALADLKVRIAEQNGLEKEFARKFDLRIFYAAASTASQEHQHQGGGGVGLPGGTGREITDDAEMIPAGSQVVVQRERWRRVEEIHHRAKKTLTAEEWKSSDQRRAEEKRVLPPEYLCVLCGFLVEAPSVAMCTARCNRCGKSACRSCIDSRMAANGGNCPYCEEEGRLSKVKSVTANIRLNQLLTILDWREFHVPRKPEC